MSSKNGAIKEISPFNEESVHRLDEQKLHEKTAKFLYFHGIGSKLLRIDTSAENVVLAQKEAFMGDEVHENQPQNLVTKAKLRRLWRWR